MLDHISYGLSPILDKLADKILSKTAGGETTIFEEKTSSPDKISSEPLRNDGVLEYADLSSHVERKVCCPGGGVGGFGGVNTRECMFVRMMKR